MQLLKGKMGILGALFWGSLLLFAVVLPGNHSEAEDAFEYSRLIEEGEGCRLFHPHHLLYLPAEKVVFDAATRLGYAGRSYYVARAVSLVSGALSLCFFYLIARRMYSSSGSWLAFWMTLGLLFSYGFIRYACEVEIYVPASAVMLAGVYCALRTDDSPGWGAACIVFSALAILMHVINAAPAIVSVALLYGLDKGRWKRAGVHVGATLLLVGLVYFVVQNQVGIFHPPTEMASEGGVRLDSLPKAVVGFGQCLLSANFVFGYSALYEKVQALFPYRMFAEEVFAGSAMPGWMRVIAPITFLLGLVAVSGLVVMFVRVVFKRARVERSLVWVLIWCGGAMFPTLILEPSNPELWIMLMVPLWLLGGGVIAHDRSLLTRRLIPVAVCLFGIHNLAVGMGMMKSKAGDYLQEKAKWVLAEATERDVVNTADSFVFSFYLDYWSAAEIRNLNTQEWAAGQRTYVFGDLFVPPASLGVRYPEQARRVERVAAELRPLCERVHANSFGGIWMVDEGARSR